MDHIKNSVTDLCVSEKCESDPVISSMHNHDIMDDDAASIACILEDIEL